MAYPFAFWPQDLKSIVDVLETLVTTAAVIMGGVWAYFRFVKDRTYRPRLEVGTFGQWRIVNDIPMLHARVTVKNIGASDVSLLQEGTGLVVHELSDAQPSSPDAVAWAALTGFSILTDHQWIEPGETVSDDLLLDLGIQSPTPVLLRCQLRWKWASGSDDIVIVNARKIIPVESRLDGTEPEPNPSEEEKWHLRR